MPSADTVGSGARSPGLSAARRVASPPAAAVLMAAVAGALWLAANPYIGIDHDARIYTFMAVHWLDPAAYARDPWFIHGSQDDWSVFSPLYAFVLARCGVETGALLTTIAGGLLFVTASIALGTAALRGRLGWLAALLLVSVPLCYSPNGMLFVSESFATARALAVPLSLIALALGLRRRLRSAAALHLVALLLHPMMALAPLAVTLLSRVAVRTSTWLVLAGLLAAVGLLLGGALGRVPVIDGDWQLLVEPAVLVFIGPWIRAELGGILAPVFVLLIACRQGSWRLRRVYGYAALVAVASVWLSLVAAAALPVAILMQAQLWRALWIAQVLGVVALVDLAGRFVLRRRAPSRWPLLVALLPLASLAPPGTAWPAVWIGSKLVSRGLWNRFAAIVLAHRRLAYLLVLVIVAMHVPAYLLSLSIASTSIDSTGALNDLATGFLRTGGYGLTAVATWWLAHRLRPLALALCVPPLLALAILLWDARSPAQKHWESRYTVDGSRRMFAAQIARGRTVYWNRSAPRVWLELGTAGYASTTHATGLVFSRERARLLAVRLKRVAIRTLTAEQARIAAARGTLLETALRNSAATSGEVTPYTLASYETSRASTPFGIAFLCGDPDLDFVIDPLKVAGMQIAEEAEDIDGRRTVSYLYDCALVRAGNAGPGPGAAIRISPAGRAG